MASITRSTALVMALALLAKALGFLRHVVVAAYFGTSQTMDALVVAVTIAGLTLVWLENPIRIVIVPLLARAIGQRGPAAAWRDTGTLLGTVMAVVIVVAALQAAVAPYLVAVVAPGLGAEAAELTATIVRVLALAVVLTGLARFLTAVGHAHQRFGRAGLAGSLDSLIVAGAVVLLGPALGIWSLTFGIVLGALAQIVLQLPLVWTDRHHLAPRIDFRSPVLGRLLRLGWPVVVGTGGSGLARVSDRFFASLLPAGRLSALSYGHQLTFAAFGLLVAPLTTVLVPALSRTAGAADHEELSRRLGRALRLLALGVVPVAVGIAVLHEPIVRLVFERGAFTEESTRLTSRVVLFYALGLPAYALSHVLGYAFYSIEDTRTPMVAGLGRLALQVALSAVLIGPLAHVGLAVAESVSFVAKALWLFLKLPAPLRGRDHVRVVRSFAVTLALGGVMAAVLVALVPPLEASVSPDGAFWTSLVVLACGAAIGGGVYLALSMALQRAEIRDLFRVVRAGLLRPQRAPAA
ncbi:MAG TPA: murein biosynthesis integral membrane protein MurJ [Candidatus Tectomicrobia bacterium]|nr:murein biosynthesis integral membrane protein MurJ [Candidatus Tectomicrobia bacterium]